MPSSVQGFPETQNVASSRTGAHVQLSWVESEVTRVSAVAHRVPVAL